MTAKNGDFLTGLIEGFYGKPWTRSERFELFEWMGGWGLNTYLYAPKDDLKHRSIWREAYSSAEAEELGELIHACGQPKIRFIYGLSPGLNIRYSEAIELEALKKRFEQMLELGCHDFALLFDDIPDRLDPEDLRRWGSLAGAQCHFANITFQWLRGRCPEARFFFCPTAYCGRMAERKLGGEGYLEILGRELHPEIDVFWTGREIISREITVDDAIDLHKVLRRKPLIWDNLHANDYDGRRFYCGPYSGRHPELRGEVSGLLLNPNCEFPLNFIPIKTLAEFVNFEATDNAKQWNPRQAYLAAMEEWMPRFANTGEPLKLEDLILFGDCYYLPQEEGPEAQVLFALAEDLLTKEPTNWKVSLAAFQTKCGRLRNACARLTEMRDRPLFHALSRRVWELREELALIERCAWLKFESPGAAWKSDFHLPGTYRGGMVAKLQRLLDQEVDGTFRAKKAGNSRAESQ